MKDTLKKIKEIWKNRRYRAIISLALYAIFFTFVFLAIDSNKPITQPLTSLEIFRDSNYQYTINEEIIVVDNVINYQGNIYEVADYPQYNFNISPKEIYSLIKIGTLKNQDYIEKSSTYLIKAEQYNDILTEKIDSNGNVYITIYEENDEINRVKVDLTEFYGYQYIMDVNVVKGRN